MNRSNNVRAQFAQGRLKTGAMNPTEVAYNALLLERQAEGAVAWFKFEGIKLRLADNTFYNPDFAVMLTDGEFQIHEVKGHWQDDARAKIKIAADLYPFRFLAVQAVPKSRGGGWQVEDFSGDKAAPLEGLRMKSEVPPPVKRPRAVPKVAPAGLAKDLRLLLEQPAERRIR